MRAAIYARYSTNMQREAVDMLLAKYKRHLKGSTK